MQLSGSDTLFMRSLSPALSFTGGISCESESHWESHVLVHHQNRWLHISLRDARLSETWLQTDWGTGMRNQHTQSDSWRKEWMWNESQTAIVAICTHTHTYHCRWANGNRMQQQHQPNTLNITCSTCNIVIQFAGRLTIDQCTNGYSNKHHSTAQRKKLINHLQLWIYSCATKAISSVTSMNDWSVERVARLTTRHFVYQ